MSANDPKQTCVADRWADEMDSLAYPNPRSAHHPVTATAIFRIGSIAGGNGGSSGPAGLLFGLGS